MSRYEDRESMLHCGPPGNILIKHRDNWRGSYYLKDDLSFTVNRSEAGRFYFLKSGNAILNGDTILNGNRIRINLGDRSITADNNGEINLTNEHRPGGIGDFLISNGEANIGPILYEDAIFLISDEEHQMALKYVWEMDFVNTGTPVYHRANNYKPRDRPRLTSASYKTAHDSHMNSFRFFLERIDLPIEESNYHMERKLLKEGRSNFLDGYKGLIMVMLLMIVLALCVTAGKY